MKTIFQIFFVISYFTIYDCLFLAEKSESSKKALTMTLIIMAANIMMGAIVLQVYAEPLFKEAVPSMHPNTCAILLAVDFVVAGLICASVVDKFGRRVRMVDSLAYYNITV